MLYMITSGDMSYAMDMILGLIKMINIQYYDIHHRCKINSMSDAVRSIDTIDCVIDNTIDGIAPIANINNVIIDVTKSTIHNTLGMITLVNTQYASNILV